MGAWKLTERENMGLSIKARHLPQRIAAGAFILNSGIAKWSADEETAAQLHGFAAGAYPVLARVKPADFVRLLAAGEITLGAALLLFANALSAFATVVAWENQIAYIVPQQIYVAINSEVGLSNVNQADVLALGMIIMVAIIMTGYAFLQRRAARWLR